MLPKVFIFSAPSGSGKTTIVRHLLNHNDHLGFSVSVTTRQPRVDIERDGKDYYFWSVPRFEEGIGKEEFVEWEKVYQGVYYGTLKSEVERLGAEGKFPVFDVDVKGGIRLKEYFKDQALAVFIRVDSLEVLEQRLRARKTETESSLKERLNKAEHELTFQDGFDVVLINDDLDEAQSRAQSLVDEFLNPV